LEQATKEGGEEEAKNLASTCPFLLSKLSKLSKAAPSKGFPLDSSLFGLSNAVQNPGQSHTRGLESFSTTQPPDGDTTENHGSSPHEGAVLDGVQTVQAEPSDAWTPFDWGDADRRFERFRRNPLLRKPEGAA
jgi:hypothetical protein